MSHNVGGSSTRSKTPATFGGYPFPAECREASGARVVCDPGDAYTDWIAGLGAVSLGYQYPEVEDAVRHQLARGVVAGPLPVDLEEETAAMLCTMLGWPEQVRWVNSGSEATEGAMRLARRAMGRSLIYSIGYHGHHQAHLPGPDLIQLPEGQIPPKDYRAAAIILELGREHHPESFYQVAWREWCDATGALYVADEVWAGFRLAIGGASERYGVVPDLACFSKALGNGYPVAAIVGPRKIMALAHEISSTFGGNGLAMAATRAVMTVYQKEPVIARLHEIGQALLEACSTMLEGIPARPRFIEQSRAVEFVQALATAGHLVHPAGVTPMYAHSDDDVQSLAAAINRLA